MPLLMLQASLATPPNKMKRIAGVYIYTPPPAGYDTKFIFKRGLTGLNWEFSFS